MNTVHEYCIACGQDGPLCRERQPTAFDVRGETLHIELPVKVCPSCGTTEVEDGFDPAEIAFAEYRRRKDLLTPERIRNIRKRYALSQKSFAALLGMSEATVNRYEGGGLQDEAHDAAIRACENLDFVRGLLERKGGKLSPWQRCRVEAALIGQAEAADLPRTMGRLWSMPRDISPLTGYRCFSYEKYAAVVVWFCQRLNTVTPTSLNKLLFYADFLHFRSESVSLTGTAYRRLQYGPVPADFGGLREQMEFDELVEVREVEWDNGNLGEQYVAGPNAHSIDVAFSPRERKVLESVAQTCERLTPTQLSQRSHSETAWRDTENRMLISYETARDLSLPVPD